MHLIEISAWNDSGGGFLNRLLDGHPELHVWPYELLLGSDAADVDSFGEDWFKGRFRWPRLGNVAQADGGSLFDRIADSELAAVLADPSAAKHRDFVVAVDPGAWRQRVRDLWQTTADKTQAGFLTIYVSAFFELWRGSPLPAQARLLAHGPVAILDAPEIWADFPDTRIVHVIRRPESGFRDMRHRHPELGPARYALKWSAVNGFAGMLAAKYPNRVRLVTFDELLGERERAMRGVCEWLEIRFSDTVLMPSWYGRPIEPGSMGPFGGVPVATAAAERQASIGADERKILSELCGGTISLLRAATDLAI